MTSSTLSAKEAWSRSLLSFFIRSNQRLIATSDHIASTIPNGHAPFQVWLFIFGDWNVPERELKVDLIPPHRQHVRQRRL
jgi:hypothetical protein